MSDTSTSSSAKTKSGVKVVAVKRNLFERSALRFRYESISEAVKKRQRTTSSLSPDIEDEDDDDDYTSEKEEEEEEEEFNHDMAICGKCKDRVHKNDLHGGICISCVYAISGAPRKPSNSSTISNKLDSVNKISKPEETLKNKKIDKDVMKQRIDKPRKLSDTVKRQTKVLTNDKDKLIREKSREMLRKALEKGIIEISKSNESNHHQLPENIDLEEISVNIEEALFAGSNNSCNESYKSRIRLLFTNLKEAKNALAVLSGAIEPSKLVTMSPEEFASDDMKKVIELARKESLEMSVINEFDPSKIVKISKKGLVVPESQEKEIKAATAAFDPAKISIPTPETEEITSPMLHSPNSPPIEPPPPLSVLIADAFNIVGDRRDSAQSANSANSDKTLSFDDLLNRAASKNVTVGAKLESPTLSSPSPVKPILELPKDTLPVDEVDEEIKPTFSPNEDSMPNYSAPTAAEITEKLNSNDSLFQPAETELPSSEVVWSGTVSIFGYPTSFTGLARCHMVPSQRQYNWHSILPPVLQVVGRIDKDTVDSFLKEVVDHDTDNLCLLEITPLGPDQFFGFEKIYKDLKDINRCYGVISGNGIMKDHYIIPLSWNDPIPKAVTFVKQNTILKLKRSADSLLLILLLKKDITPINLNSDPRVESMVHPSRSGYIPGSSNYAAGYSYSVDLHSFHPAPSAAQRSHRESLYNSDQRFESPVYEKRESFSSNEGGKNFNKKRKSEKHERKEKFGNKYTNPGHY